MALLVFLLGSSLSFAQNTCATAATLTAGTTVVTIIDGTNVASACSDADKAEWYKYTPIANYTVTVSSDLPVNVCKDTNFSVYTGPCGALVCYTGDDDSGTVLCSSNNSSYLSKKTFDVIAGTPYYIVWDNKWNTNGFTFQLTEAPPTPCATATTVTAGITTVASVNGANVTTPCSNATQAKWYKYTPTQDYHVTVSSDLAANICKDTNFNVYSGNCNDGLSCLASDDNSGVIACNSGNTNSNLSVKTFDVAAGNTYYIVWDNKWSNAGFDFQISEEEIVYPVSYTVQTVGTINSEYNICVVDMNNDGKDDIAGVSQNNLRIHYQGAGGALTYTDYGMPGGSLMPYWSLAAGDYNKDGYNDLLLGSGDGLTFWKSNSTGTAYTINTPGQDIFCQRTNFTDLNNDGNLDAFSCHDIAPNVYYINDGNANMSHYQVGVTSGSMMLGSIGGNYASLWTDYDNDGDSDLFITKCSGPPCELHRNDGGGVFTDVSAAAQINFTPVQAWSSAVADFDNDGDMDILIGSNGSVKTRLYRNNLDTTNSVEEPFTNITAGSGWDADNTMNRDYIAYDFNNDGFIDVMGSGGKIMFNMPDTNTFSPTYYPGLGVGAVGDLNNDGFLDILNGNTIRYAVPNGNKWLKVVLTGVQSNRNGIGARVEIYGTWGKQIRDVRSGEGFEFMSTLNTHFGLGAATAIDAVIIRWPSGTVDTILNPGVNQTLTVLEGSFALGAGEVNSNTFSVYPNPASDQLNIKMGSALAELKEAQIFDLSGRLVSSPVVTNEAISVKELATGTYILILRTTDGKSYNQKFIKK